MYAIDFEYAGERLSDYGMIICSFDGGKGIETISSGSDITFNQIASNKGNRFFIGSSTYESALTSTFQICKNSCLAKTQDEMSISLAELSAIQRWLCRKNQYNRFKIIQDGFENIYWNVTFSAKQVELNGRIIGMELTLYADAPFAYMDELTIDVDCSENLTFDIYDMSDEEGYIYPNMEITILEDANRFVLTNQFDVSRPLIITNCAANEVITIRGKEHIITSSAGRNLSNNFNFYYPRILNSYIDNKNTFECTTKCNITISYSPIRKVGI